MRYSPDKNFSGFDHACGPALESDILNVEILLYNFTSISNISQNFRTIRSMVTKNSVGQNLGGKKKKWKKKKKKNKKRKNKKRAETKGFAASLERLSNKKLSKNNWSPLFAWETL